MLNRGPARQLASRLDSAAPLLYSVADLENRLAIHRAFLDAWLAERIEAVRADDCLQVKAWLEIAKARSESGADPAFQLEMVKGELIKSRLDWEEAKRARIQAWNMLRSLSDLPEAPQSLDSHPQEGALDTDGFNAREMEALYKNGAMRRASAARQGIEQSQINLQTALSDSRWSLSGSYAKESDERITKIGIAYRFRRSGEASAMRAEQRARLEASKRNTDLELAGLDLRFASAMQTIASNEDYPEAPDIPASLEALTLRLQEGKDQPSEVIPTRRQFLEIRIAELQRAHSLHLAHAELLTLTAGVQP
jgi:outer membrane protein TolC